MMPPEDNRLLAELVAEHPRELIFATVSGAHLYGFPSPDSDVDLRGVHLLTADELLGLHPRRETIQRDLVRSKRELDIVTHDARKFFRLMLKPNGYVLEQLFSPLVVHTTPHHEELRALGQRCITRRHVRHYLGFARNQWDLFRKEDPPRIKPLLYVYRVLLTGIHLMRTGVIEASLLRLLEQYPADDVQQLVRAKTSGSERETLDPRDLARQTRQFQRLTETLEDAGAQSTLPDEPTARAGLEDLLVRLRLATIGA